MGVSSHLGIAIEEYDRRIRTFIPRYEEMLDAAARAVSRGARVVVDLGIGTGALSARCLARLPGARVIGIDADPEMLGMARLRLPDTARLATGNFLRTPLPRADAVVASFALHHVRTRPAKARLYRRIRRALGGRGAFVSADTHPAADRRIARRHREAWLAHLRRAYSSSEAAALLRAWADEDVYQPLEVECALLAEAGFEVEVVWRSDGFAVLKGRPRK